MKAIAVWVVACTVEAPPAPAASPRVIATSPVQGQTDVARNGAVSFWFDLPLDPASIGSQAVDVTSREVRQGGVIHYDPIQRRLDFAPQGIYRQGLAYDAIIEHERLRSLRDGRPVEPATVTFVTGHDVVDRPVEPIASFEDEVLPLFAARCAFDGCHGGSRPAIGLDLSSARAASATAIAHRTTSGWPGWPVIDAGSSAWSYLIYKVIDEESIIGRRMPVGRPLEVAEIALLSRWIDQGANVDPAPPEP